MPARWLAFGAVLMVLAGPAYGLGADMGEKERAAAARALVPGEAWGELRPADCVHGFWVNSEDVLFFRGDTAQLNAALAGMARTRSRVRVVLDPGEGRARSPWADEGDKADDHGPAQWVVSTTPVAGGDAGAAPVSVVRVFLGGAAIDADVLVVPEGVAVTRVEAVDEE